MGTVPSGIESISDFDVESSKSLRGNNSSNLPGFLLMYFGFPDVTLKCPAIL